MARTIKELLKLFVQPKGNWKIEIMQNWDTIFGNLSKHITLEKINQSTVTLGVYDSCWMQELYLLSPTLLTAINATLDQPYIKQIRFKKVVRRRPKKDPVKKIKRKIVPPKKLTPREQEALAPIKDAALRTALQSFLQRCHQE